MLLVHLGQDRNPRGERQDKQAKRYFIPARYALPRRLPRVTDPLREMDPKLWRLFPPPLAAPPLPLFSIVLRARAGPGFLFFFFPPRLYRVCYITAFFFPF